QQAGGGGIRAADGPADDVTRSPARRASTQVTPQPWAGFSSRPASHAHRFGRSSHAREEESGSILLRSESSPPQPSTWAVVPCSMMRPCCSTMIRSATASGGLEADVPLFVVVQHPSVLRDPHGRRRNAAEYGLPTGDDVHCEVRVLPVFDL